MKKETKFFIVIAGAIALLYFYSKRKQEEERKCENIVDPGHNIIVGGLLDADPRENLPWYMTASAEEIEGWVNKQNQGDADKEEEADDTSTTGNDLPPLDKLEMESRLKKPISTLVEYKANRIKGFICKQY